MSTYQPGIPTGTVVLSQDYQNLQNNFQQLDTSFGVDHTQFSVNTLAQPEGYHKSIHLIPQSTPVNVSGFGQVWSNTQNDGIANDQTLFFQTGTGNNNIQLTRNFLPVAATNGYTFIAGPAGTSSSTGALIIQWMKINNPASSTTYNFPLAFPNNCFSIQLTPSVSDSSTVRCYLSSGTLTKTGFQIQASSTSSFTSLYVVAIGN